MAASVSGVLGGASNFGLRPVSEQYFREGVGVTLNSGQLAQATQLQDEYVHYICRQAGGFNVETAVGQSCDVSWTAFTVAGMNDIDQRCDAYLDWLDAQRRDRTPVLAQIAAMGAATSEIMGVAGLARRPSPSSRPHLAWPGRATPTGTRGCCSMSTIPPCKPSSRRASNNIGRTMPA